MPYDFGDLEKDPTLENHPYADVLRVSVCFGALGAEDFGVSAHGGSWAAEASMERVVGE